MRHRQHRHIHLHRLQLSNRQRCALGMAGDDQHVRAKNFHLLQRRGHIVQFGRQFIVDDDLHAELLGVRDHAGANVLRERIVLERQRNPHAGRFLTLCFSRLRQQ